MTLAQQNMQTLGFLSSNRDTARFSLKLLLGVWLVACLPAVAQPSLQPHILIAQRISLSEGSRGPAVSELQRQLGRNGLFPADSVDGVYGSATTHAVRQFQRIRRLPVTGVADEETLDLLGVDTNQLTRGLSHPIHGAISGDRITANSNRDDIRTLQRVLISFGFDLEPDGVYGSQTVRAVRAYQRTADIPVDGIANRATLLDMGFESGNFNGSSPEQPINRAVEGRYVAAVIANRSELSRVQRSFPNATLASNNLGDYISLGRFRERSDAADRVDAARDLGYEARVLRD